MDSSDEATIQASHAPTGVARHTVTFPVLRGDDAPLLDAPDEESGRATHPTATRSRAAARIDISARRSYLLGLLTGVLLATSLSLIVFAACILGRAADSDPGAVIDMSGGAFHRADLAEAGGTIDISGAASSADAGSTRSRRARNPNERYVVRRTGKAATPPPLRHNSFFRETTTERPKRAVYRVSRVPRTESSPRVYYVRRRRVFRDDDAAYRFLVRRPHLGGVVDRLVSTGLTHGVVQCSNRQCPPVKFTRQSALTTLYQRPMSEAIAAFYVATPSVVPRYTARKAGQTATQFAVMELDASTPRTIPEYGVLADYVESLFDDGYLLQCVYVSDNVCSLNSSIVGVGTNAPVEFDNGYLSHGYAFQYDADHRANFQRLFALQDTHIVGLALPDLASAYGSEPYVVSETLITITLGSYCADDERSVYVGTDLLCFPAFKPRDVVVYQLRADAPSMVRTVFTKGPHSGETYYYVPLMRRPLDRRIVLGRRVVCDTAVHLCAITTDYCLQFYYTSTDIGPPPHILVAKHDTDPGNDHWRHGLVTPTTPDCVLAFAIDARDHDAIYQALVFRDIPIVAIASATITGFSHEIPWVYSAASLVPAFRAYPDGSLHYSTDQTDPYYAYDCDSGVHPESSCSFMRLITQPTSATVYEAWSVAPDGFSLLELARRRSIDAMHAVLLRVIHAFSQLTEPLLRVAHDALTSPRFLSILDKTVRVVLRVVSLVLNEALDGLTLMVPAIETLISNIFFAALPLVQRLASGLDTVMASPGLLLGIEAALSTVLLTAYNLVSLLLGILCRLYAASPLAMGCPDLLMGLIFWVLAVALTDKYTGPLLLLGASLARALFVSLG